MFLLVFFLICLFAALFVGGLAAWSDLRGMTIPNRYSAAIGSLFLLAFLSVFVLRNGIIFSSIASHAVAAAVVFVITALMFAARAIGAADSKLATVFALWVGVSGLPAFLFYMTLAGGVLGLAALAIRKWKLFPAAPAGSWPALVKEGADKVPYGVAIVFGALVSFVYVGYLDPSTLSEFISGD